MSENIKPEVTEVTEVTEVISDVDLSSKTLVELTAMLKEVNDSQDRLSRSSEVENLKSAFYKRLIREKAEAGQDTEVQFGVLEAAFKEIYTEYRAARTEYNKRLEAEKAVNLEKKQRIVEDLKTLVEGDLEMKDAFPKFREIQNEWRATGPVPAPSVRDINDTYQLYVEKFYDLVAINRDLRDLDFKKNLEAKTELCEQAEALAAPEADAVESFRVLQHLHEQWKELGPVAKEFRESIWERFRAATSLVNKKYQAHFDELKASMIENLKAKEELCERVEEIAARDITSSSEWNKLTKAIEEIQAEWRKIGMAPKKDNQKIYERFRAACDAFFSKKRVFYNKFKEGMNENLEKKLAIIERVEALRGSKEWKKTTEEIINLQKQWKEIGAVPRKKSEMLWKRFRAACDAFFQERDKNAVQGGNDMGANLKAKKALIENISAYELTGDAEADLAKAKEFQAEWDALGFVPFKLKESINSQYRSAMKEKFPAFGRRSDDRHERGRRSGGSASPKDVLMEKFNQLQQDIRTYENNIGFFGTSKGAETLKAQMQEKIDAAKAELQELREKIRSRQEEAEQKEQEKAEE